MKNHSSKNINAYESKLAVLKHVKYEHLIAGISGGAISTLILHPLDLLKIRFAVCDGRTPLPAYGSLSGAFLQIVKQEGVKGLYRGVTPNVWGSGSAWGCYFMFYNMIKTWIQRGDVHKPLGPSLHMLAAAEAGILTLFMTNPIWVVKTRLCLQYGDMQSIPISKRYTGMGDALTKIYREEGVRGLYRGLVPGLFGVTHGALQFMTYEEMKNCYNQYRRVPINTKLTTVEYLTFAAISKLIAAAATYPYQVIRARLQDQHHSYGGTWDCVKKTWRYERMGGFYKVGTPGKPFLFFSYFQNQQYKIYKINCEEICNSKELETVAHFVLSCPIYAGIGAKYLATQLIPGMGPLDQLALQTRSFVLEMQDTAGLN